MLTFFSLFQDKISIMTSPRDKNPRFFLLGTVPTEDDKEINGTRLPTVKQILLCFLAHHTGSTTKREAANAVVNSVIPFYGRARVRTLAPQKMSEEIEKLLVELKSIMKINVVSRETESNKKKIYDFKMKLETTMKLWPRNALEVMTNESDKSFLRSMMDDRKASMGAQDKITSSTEEKVASRKQEENKRQEKEKICKEKTHVVEMPGFSTEEENVEDDDNYATFEVSTPTTSRSHKRVVKTGTPGFWPHNILKSPEIVESSVRNKITPTALADIAHSFIAATSGDPDKVNLDYTSAYRYRVESVVNIATKIKESWEPPKRGILHWDGKLMDTLDNEYAVEDRLPVLLSGVGGVKLLGVPALPHKSTDKSGPQLAKLAKDLLDEWECAGNVVGMVFDTTSSNTGAITAGCVSVQSALDKSLLWLACRHHIGEIVLSKVWDSLKIEASKSPDITIFTRFKENYEAVEYADVEDLDIPEVPASLKEKRVSIIQLCKEALALKQNIVRGDYMELVKLTLVYLQDEENSFRRFERPGALHKARWMAKILYSMKIVMLNKKIKESGATILGRGQLTKLKKFLQFVVYCYIPWWISAPVPSAAPSNDLELVNNLLKYKSNDSVSAEAALNAVSRHMWYLTQELVPLSLFSHSVTVEAKQKIIGKLQQFEVPDTCSSRIGSGYGKPQFPALPSQVENDLSIFVGTDSWMFFKILKLDESFLTLPVKDWESNSAYKEAEEVVSNLSVVNDAAERGVKLCHDFLHSSKKEGNLQNILQVVENCRSRLPNQRKRQLKSKNWFLSL